MNQPFEQSSYLSHFTPSRTAPEDLEAIFVQREPLLQDIIERIEHSATTDNKHHQLIVGPRGSGKSHLSSMLINRLKKREPLEDKLRIAWLNEDETCLSLLELLLNIVNALHRSYPAEYPSTTIEKAYDKNKAEAEAFLANTLSHTLQTTSTTCLVVLENLDQLFETLGSSEQKKLRAFLQENPFFTLFATAQKLTDDLSNRDDPFFGFFQTEHLKPLTEQEAALLLGKIAKLNQQPNVEKFLKTKEGKSRIQALHHLSGGNHRIYIVLSQFISRDSVDSLVKPFLKMVDELTPYYQERIRWLPPLQRKISETLCISRSTMSVSQIAKRLFSTNQTIASQLKELRQKGYVHSHKRGRESLYEISEPLMRICIEVKENQNNKPIDTLVRFLRAWYGGAQLEEKLLNAGVRTTSTGKQYLKTALEEEFLHQATNYIIQGDIDKSKEYLTKIINIPNASKEQVTNALLNRGVMFGQKGDIDEELADYSDLIETPEAPIDLVAQALLNRGIVHGQKGNVDRELADYSDLIEMPGAPADLVAQALLNRGSTHGQKGNTQGEMADYSQLIEVPNAPLDLVVSVLLLRGVYYGKKGDADNAINDSTRLIETRAASNKQVAQALLLRSFSYGHKSDFDKAIDDSTQLIEMPNAPNKQVAEALFFRGFCYITRGNIDKGIADYARLIDMPDANPGLVTEALLLRGFSYSKIGDIDKGLADYTQLIYMPDASLGQVADALYNRGRIHSQKGEIDKGLADYTLLIDIPDAPLEYVAQSLFNRGIIYRKEGDLNKSTKDFTCIFNHPSLIDTGFQFSSYMEAASNCIEAGEWLQAKEHLYKGLTIEPKDGSPVLYSSYTIIRTLFENDVYQERQLDKFLELISLLSSNQSALQDFGSRLIEHLGALYQAREALSLEKINTWTTSWQSALNSTENLEVVCRLFNVGAKLLSSKDSGKDVLLDLIESERTILIQAFGLTD